MKSLEELGISPAPWSVEYRRGFITDQLCELVAVCGFGTKYKKANARLIAAAPDLYEALEECERKIDAIDPYCSSLEKVRDALAKAGGEGESK